MNNHDTSVEMFGFPMKVRNNFWDREILSEEMKLSYYHLPKDMKVLVDIGAHIGGTTIIAASLGAKVYAFEPDPDNCDLLLTNLGINEVRHLVSVQNVAVSDKKGHMTLVRNDRNAGGYGSYADGDGLSPRLEVDVPTITLSEALEDIEQIDVLKCDCEGAEYDFFFNTDESIFDRIKQISMELHFATQEHKSATLAAKYGHDYTEKLLALLGRHYKVEMSNSPADSAKFLLCTKV